MVDIDRFFTLGPGTHFLANDVFTDREACLAAFRARALALSSRRWDVAQLTNFQRPAHNIVCYVGSGGLGKSAVIRQAARLAVNGQLGGPKTECAVAVIDFTDAATRSYETVLLRVRAAFGRLTRSLPAFDLALALYWERKHPGEPLSTFLTKSPPIGKAADALRASDQITSALDHVLGGVGVAGVGYRLAQIAGHAAKQTVTIKRIHKEMPAFRALIEERDADRMLGYLPILLAYDLERRRSRSPILPLCLLDTLESIQGAPPETGSLEDLICRMVYLMPNALFLAASRSQLTWHDPIQAIGLTYGGSDRWPGLTGADQIGMDGFADAAADEFLRTRLTLDEQPVISEELRRRIISGADGSPLYLDLSVTLFERVMARGETLGPEIFGQPFPELVLRLMRDLDTGEQDLLRAAALVESFDEQLLASSLPGARPRQIEKFCSRSFVRHQTGVWPPYRLHDNVRNCVAECDTYMPTGWTPAERQRNALLAMAYLEELGLSVWHEAGAPALTSAEASRRAVAAFLLCVSAAAEHGVLPPRLGHLVFTLYELGYWQVLAGTPDFDNARHPVLAQLCEVARLAGQTDTDTVTRFARLRQLAAELAETAYAGVAGVILGNLAFIVGDLSAAAQHFAPLLRDVPPISSAAILGMAGCAQRQSRFADQANYAARLSGSAFDRTRVTDTLGHLHMHNALFVKASELFGEALETARESGAPLWIARAARHRAMACMWTAPDMAAGLIPEAREFNVVLADGFGRFQCDLATAMVALHRGEHAEAARAMGAARSGIIGLGGTFDLLPVEAVEILFHLAGGDVAQAKTVARRLIDAEHAHRPLGPPVWCAVAALWVGEDGWYEFDHLDWLEPASARERWLAPLNMLRSVAPTRG